MSLSNIYRWRLRVCREGIGLIGLSISLGLLWNCVIGARRRLSFFTSHLMLTISKEIVLGPLCSSGSTEFIYGDCKVNTALLSCASADSRLSTTNSLLIKGERLLFFWIYVRWPPEKCRSSTHSIFWWYCELSVYFGCEWLSVLCQRSSLAD